MVVDVVSFMIFQSVYAQSRKPFVTRGRDVAISVVESLLLLEKPVSIEYLYLRI